MASSTILKRLLATRLNQSSVVESLKVSPNNLYGNLIANTAAVMPGGTGDGRNFSIVGHSPEDFKSMDNPTLKTTTTSSSNPNINRLDPSVVGYSQEDLKSTDKLFELFESWMAKHKKIYDSDEEKLRRFEVFKDNVKHIDKMNKGRTRRSLVLNDWTDLTYKEVLKKRLSHRYRRAE